jgi:hypothetical protein
MMDFELEETQQVVARLAGEVLSTAPPDGAWKALGQAGLLELDVLETAVLLREIGKHALVSPALPHLVATRFAPPDPDALYTIGFGTVPYADSASLILMPVERGVALVDPAVARLERVHSSSGAPEFTVTFDDAPVKECDVEEVRQTAIVYACALGDGLLAGALALTRDHIAQREQFGKPLATFQGAAMQIADVYIASRTLHLAALSAAWRLATGRDASSDVDTAATWLAQEAPAALRTCHHLHGGIGLDITYPLHRYSAMVKDLVRYVPRSL